MDWTRPTELTGEEYTAMVSEIRQQLRDAAATAESTTEPPTASTTASGISNQNSSVEEDDDETCSWGQELLDAARYNDVDVVRALCHAHWEEQQPEPMGSSLSPTASSSSLSALLLYVDPLTGNTAMHMAAANGHVAVLELLSAVAASSSTSEHETVSPTTPEPPFSSSSSSLSWLYQNLVICANRAGNTPLHWAAANGQESTVAFLLNTTSSSSTKNNNTYTPTAAPVVEINVLAQNKAGRSILTEAFASNNAAVTELILSHDSASEELLLQTTPTASSSVVVVEDKDDDGNPTITTSKNPPDLSVTHHFVFGRGTELQVEDGGDDQDDNGIASSAAAFSASAIHVLVREQAMARNDGDVILGQELPTDDTTGLSVWASSLVAAQWIADIWRQASEAVAELTIATTESTEHGKAAYNTSLPKTSSSTDSQMNAISNELIQKYATVLELGAGCGVPGLTWAAAAAKYSHLWQSPAKSSANSSTVHLTDSNPSTVENLLHNITLNQSNVDEGATPPSSDETALKPSPVSILAQCMNWHDSSSWPTNGVDLIIGSDLVYQLDMVPVLVQTILSLQPKRFLYVAPDATGRCGHEEFLSLMHQSQQFVLTTKPAPYEYALNPMQSNDNDEFFVHFHELAMAAGNASQAPASSINTGVTSIPLTDAHLSSRPQRSIGFTLYDFVWNLQERKAPA